MPLWTNGAAIVGVATPTVSISHASPTQPVAPGAGVESSHAHLAELESYVPWPEHSSSADAAAKRHPRSAASAYARDARMPVCLPRASRGVAGNLAWLVFRNT